MTMPRQVLPGASYLLTRRCSERRFLLRPSDDVNAVFRFVLAVAARRYGIRLHAFCVLSNHVHLVVTDPDARLPEFQRFLNGFVARAVNALHGRWEAFWDPRSFSAVRLVSPDDIVNEVAYTLANPVLSGLVRTARIWPGAWSDPERFGAGPMEVSRPGGFFAEGGAFPEKDALELTVPPGFSSAEEFRDRVLAAMAAKEREGHEKHGGKFLGVKAALAQDPFGCPRSFEPRRGLSPRIAARDKWKRIEALLRLKTFVDAYREAWAARRAGNLNAVFPAGTYLMRVLHGAPCEASA
jgi:REP element-mobilizing transposase RayT